MALIETPILASDASAPPPDAVGRLKNRALNIAFFGLDHNRRLPQFHTEKPGKNARLAGCEERRLALDNRGSAATIFAAANGLQNDTVSSARRAI